MLLEADCQPLTIWLTQTSDLQPSTLTSVASEASRAPETWDHNPVIPLSWGQLCTARSEAGAPNTEQHSLIQLLADGFPDRFVRARSGLWLPLSPTEQSPGKARTLKLLNCKWNMQWLRAMLCFAGKHCHDNCFYKKKLQLWQKKKINPLFARTHHKPLLVIIGSHCATV